MSGNDAMYRRRSTVDVSPVHCRDKTFRWNTSVHHGTASTFVNSVLNSFLIVPSSHLREVGYDTRYQKYWSVDAAAAAAVAAAATIAVDAVY